MKVRMLVTTFFYVIYLGISSWSNRTATEVSEKHDYWKEEDRIIGVLADNMNFDNKNAENEPK